MFSSFVNAAQYILSVSKEKPTYFRQMNSGIERMRIRVQQGARNFCLNPRVGAHPCPDFSWLTVCLAPTFIS